MTFVNTVAGIHARMLAVIRKDLAQVSLHTTPGGRHLLPVRASDRSLYVRTIWHGDCARYAINSIRVPEDMEQQGLIQKIIDTVTAHAPTSVDELAFELVRNEYLLRHLLQHGFEVQDDSCVLKLR